MDAHFMRVYNSGMFGLGPSYEVPLALIVALAVWYHVFVRNRRFSILAMLLLMAIVAAWLAIFRPWQSTPIF